MDLYYADSTFTATEVIEDYDSFIWTERYSAFGEVTLYVPESHVYTHGLKSWNYLLMSESKRVMQIESVENTRQTKQKNLVKVTGRSLEAFLMHRNNKTFAASGPEKITGAAGGIARYLVNRYCIDPATAGETSVIPNLTWVQPPTTPTITMYVERGDIYSRVKSICDANGLGFAIIKNPGDPVLYFTVYQGLDRSDPNDEAMYMEYSPNNETLFDVRSFESIAGYKNHARVLGAKTSVDAFSPGTPNTVSGFDRRTILVEATDIGSAIDEEDPEKITTIADDQAALVLRGQEVLAEENNKYIHYIDGKVPQNKWNDTYWGLGDIVMLKDVSGDKSKSRITEQIWSASSSGEEMVPTFEQVD